MGATALRTKDAESLFLRKLFRSKVLPDTSPACLVGTGRFLLIFSSPPRSWIETENVSEVLHIKIVVKVISSGWNALANWEAISQNKRK